MIGSLVICYHPKWPKSHNQSLSAAITTCEIFIFSCGCDNPMKKLQAIMVIVEQNSKLS